VLGIATAGVQKEGNASISQKADAAARNKPEVKQMKNWKNEILHYIVVYGVLLLVWLPLMNYFAQDITKTALGGFVVFILTDKTAHWIFKLG
jgi:hypothetical protein